VIGPDGGAVSLDGGLPVEPGDALVVATSGTTGEPKGVVLTHDAVQASALATSSRLGVNPTRHRWLACLPLSHVGGLSVVTRALVTGAPLTVLEGFDAVTVMAEAGSEVLVSLVPAVLGRVDPASFRTVLLGGSAPPRRLPPNVVPTYGMTETGSGIVYAGCPLDGVEVEVDGTSEEVRVRGPMLLRAYRDGSVPLDSGGWFATGDAGSLDSEGRLAVHGRLSELIVTGGENVWPVPIEAIIRSHPCVADVAVGARADPDWGERVVAWVVPAAGAGAPPLEALRDLVSERLPTFWAPRELVVVGSLPRTSMGKLQRDSLA
jgi:O-succinylbenzoic acid--CoA ligase